MKRTGSIGAGSSLGWAASALAAWRLAMLIQQDSITEPLRSRFLSRWFPAPSEFVSAVRVGWRLERSVMPGGGMRWTQDVQIPVTAPPGRGWEAFTQTDKGEIRVMGWQHSKGTKIGQMLTCMACLTVWTALTIRVARRIPGLRILAGVLEAAGGALALEYVLDAAVAVRQAQTAQTGP